MRNREESHHIKQARIAQYKLTLYIAWIALISMVACAINAGIVFALVKGIEPRFSEVHGIQQILQFILAIAPVLLLFGQWRVWDALTAKRMR